MAENAKSTSMNVQKELGIGPMSQPSARPLNSPTPLSGPSYWAANDNNRQSAFAERGEYVHGDPAPQGTAPYPASRLVPTSDVTGNAALPGAENIGRKGPVPPLGEPMATFKPAGEPPAVNNC